MSAFVAAPLARADTTPSGPFAGLRFALENLIDVAGVPTGGGNLNWLAGHGAMPCHAMPCHAMPCAGIVNAWTLGFCQAFMLRCPKFMSSYMFSNAKPVKAGQMTQTTVTKAAMAAWAMN